MWIIPAIDLLDQKVVRLLKGKREDVTVYSDQPIEMAKQWMDCGIERLHLVDLNGAFKGSPHNFSVIEGICKAADSYTIDIQVGGGIRSVETLKSYLDCGVSQGILGTVLVEEPQLLKQALQKYPDQVMVAMDMVNGQVKTHGWKKESGLTIQEFLDPLKNENLAAAKALIFTDILRDGTLAGVNEESLCEVIQISSIPVIASGGVSNLEDVQRLKRMDPPPIGVIMGKAIYEGKLDVREAVSSLT